MESSASAAPRSHSADPEVDVTDAELDDEFKTLKYHLLGPSLTKAGQDRVDQSKVKKNKKPHCSVIRAPT